MRNFRKLPVYLFATLALLVVSCEKVIDLDLDEADQQFVIEGFVTEGESTHIVTVTKSLPLDNPGAIPGINNAVVILTDNLGNTQTLTSIGNGQYEAVGYPGVEGRTYTLSVSVDGQVFQASSTIPGVVPIDSLMIDNFIFGPDTVPMITPARFDPAGVANYYQFYMFRNGERLSGINLQDDQFTDGNYQLQPLFAFDFETGDTARVEMYGIDKPVYKYFYALSQNNEDVTPANPTSNFTGCLGYFSARTKSVETVIIP